MAWLAVAIGGALGSVARHGMNHLIHGRWPLMTFPLATLIVNLVGCAIIGLLAGLVMSERIHLRFYWREFVFVGILGGFTTFSTFGLDTITLVKSHSTAAATWNVLAQVGLGLIAVQAGIWIGTAR
jgi:CrcB protein